MAASVTSADDSGEVITLLDLHDRIDDLARELRKQQIDCSFVERRMRLIETLPRQAQVQQLNRLIVQMQRNSEECHGGTWVPSSSGGSTDCSTAAGRCCRRGLPEDGAADPDTDTRESELVAARAPRTQGSPSVSQHVRPSPSEQPTAPNSSDTRESELVATREPKPKRKANNTQFLANNSTAKRRQPSGITMTDAYYQVAAAFVTWAVKWMRDKQAEGKPVAANTVPVLEAAYGKSIRAFFSGRYMTLGRLHEAALAGDASIALNAIGEKRAPFKDKSMEEILDEQPGWRPIAEFCVQAINQDRLKKKKTTQLALQAAWRDTEGLYSVKSMFCNGAVTMEKLRKYATSKCSLGDESVEKGAEPAGQPAHGGGGGNSRTLLRPPAAGAAASVAAGADSAEEAVAEGAEQPDHGGASQDGLHWRTSANRDDDVDDGAPGASMPAAADADSAEEAVEKGAEPAGQPAHGGGGGTLPQPDDNCAPGAAMLASGAGASGAAIPGSPSGSLCSNAAICTDEAYAIVTEDEYSRGSNSSYFQLNRACGGGQPSAPATLSAAHSPESPPLSAAAAQVMSDATYLTGKRVGPSSAAAPSEASSAAATAAVASAADAAAVAGGKWRLPASPDGSASAQGEAVLHASGFNGHGYVLQASSDSDRSLSLRGIGCSFYRGERLTPLDVDVKTVPVPKNGACFIAAALGGIARLDIERLKLLPCLGGVDWVAVKRWADYGLTIKEKDASCADFRAAMLASLWERGAEVASLFPSGPVVDLDVLRVEWSSAVVEAASRGFDLEASKSSDPVDIYRVKKWAVALLGSKMQATDAVMQAFLHLEFQNRLGILVLTRTAPLQNFQEQKQIQFIYRLLPSQQLVAPEARLAVAIVHQFSSKELDDANIKKQAVEELKNKTGQKQTRSRTKGKTAIPEPSEAEIERQMVLIKQKNWEACHNKSHFEGAMILNCEHGAYILSEDSAAISADSAMVEAGLANFAAGAAELHKKPVRSCDADLPQALAPPAVATGAAPRAPFFSQLILGSSTSAQAVLFQRSVFDHMLHIVADALEKLFLTHQLSRPRSWGEFSVDHRNVMKSFMADVHKKRGAATLDATLLTLKPLDGEDAFQSGAMLNDTCLDWMLECLVRALGSRMLGVNGGTCSPLLTINAGLAQAYYVLGVGHAEAVRKTVRNKGQDTDQCDQPGNQVHDGCSSWTVPEESEPTEVALQRVVRDLVGADNVDEALGHKLDPFDTRDVILVATFHQHTKVLKLARDIGDKRHKPQAGNGLRWSVSAYDSLTRLESKWDDLLRMGMSMLLEITGLKTGRFSYKSVQSVQQGAGEVVCGYMAFINVIQILTGETLAEQHWPCCVDVICVFFDLWHFEDAESVKAIRSGYLAEMLIRAVQDTELIRLLQQPHLVGQDACVLPLKTVDTLTMEISELYDDSSKDFRSFFMSNAAGTAGSQPVPEDSVGVLGDGDKSAQCHPKRAGIYGEAASELSTAQRERNGGPVQSAQGESAYIGDLTMEQSDTECDGEHDNARRKCLLGPRLRPLALTRNHSSLKLPQGETMPLRNFILLDISQRFRGLLPGDVVAMALGALSKQSITVKAQEMRRAVERTHDFMQFLRAAIETDLEGKGAKTQPVIQKPLLDETRMETLMPGKYATQEVGDVLLQFLCKLIGADYHDTDGVQPGNDPWPVLKAAPKPEDPRFLVFSTQMAATVCFYFDNKNHAKCVQWADRVSKVLTQGGYNASSWAVPSHEHYTAVTLREDSSDSAAHVMRCTQADSASGNGNKPKLHPGLLQGFEAVCAKLHRQPALSLENGPLGPKQKAPDCLFFTILSQMATVAGVPPQVDDPSGQMHAALLRFYAYTVLVQDWIDCGFITANMDNLFSDWFADSAAVSPNSVIIEMAFRPEERQTQSLLDVSEKAAAELIQLISQCPYDKEIFRLMVSNSDRESALELSLFRHHFHPRLVKSNSNALKRILRPKRTETRRQLLENCVRYIHAALISSCLAENAKYRRNIVNWVRGEFLPVSTRVLGPSAEILQPIISLLEQDQHVTCPSSGDGQEGADNGADEDRQSEVEIVAVSSDFVQFCNLREHCYKCRESTGNPHVCALCKQRTCCRRCFGAAQNFAKKLKYVCDLCLRDFQTNYPGQSDTLLYPAQTFKRCSLCFCSLEGCGGAGLCSNMCKRLYCNKCLGLTSVDFKKNGRQKVPTACAHVDCILCVGLEPYTRGRRKQMLVLLRETFPSTPFDDLQRGHGISAYELQTNKTTAKAFADWVSALYRMGLRALFEECLPVLMHMTLVQIQPPQSVSVSPHDMLFYVRPPKPGETMLATALMLEKISAAHAAMAEKAALDLLKQSKVPPPPKERVEGQPYSVIFYAPDLFQRGPTNSLAGDTIAKFSNMPGVDVWTYGDGPVQCEYPPAKELADHFRQRSRLVELSKSPGDNTARQLEDLERFRVARPDAVFVLSGWQDMAAVLYALAQDGVLIFNTLGSAGPLHSTGVTATLAGTAMGKLQLSSETRESLALFSQGDTNQPAQSHHHLNDVKAASRRDWNLPTSYIVFFPAATDLLDEKSIFVYCDLLSMPEFRKDCMLIFDRPETMRFQISEWVGKYVAAKSCGSKTVLDLSSRFLFRPFPEDAPAFNGLIDAICNEGDGGVGIGSFGSVSPYACVQGLLKRRMLLFATNNPEGLMADRMTAEVLEAAGLGQLCVGVTDRETVEKVVRYRQSRALQKMAREHLDTIIKDELGLFNTSRTPSAWKAVLEHYCRLRDDGDKPDKMLNFLIPKNKSPAPEMVIDPVAASIDAIIGQLHGTEPEMEEVTRNLLSGLASEADVAFVRVEGCGTFVNTICCRRSDGQLVALKLAKKSHPANRTHNCPVTRESAIMLVAHDKLRKHEFKDIFPAPLFLLDKGASFSGTTTPDARGRVLPFLFCEFITRKIGPELSKHRASWQEHGFIDELLRLEVFCPLSQALFYAHENGIFISDLKPDNIRLRENGRPVFIDLGLGHRFSADGGNSKGNDTAPCLLTRRASTLIAQEQAAAQGHGRPGKPLPQGLMRIARSKPGALFLSIPRKEVRAFWNRACIHGLANLADGTRGFVDKKLITAMKIWRKIIAGAGQSMVKALDRNLAFEADRYAMHRMFLLILTQKNGETILGWDARASEAAREGAGGIRRMLVDALYAGVEVQQEMALNRMVNFFTLALGPENRFADTAHAMLHGFNTLPCLPPAWDLALRRGEGIQLAGGCVRDLFGYPHTDFQDQELPAVEFAEQTGKGMGARALEDIAVGTVIGPYVGEDVPSPTPGAKTYITPYYPSRYQVSIQGNVPLLKKHGKNKLSCDGQVTRVRDVEWARKHNNIGPFLNAAWLEGMTDADGEAQADSDGEAEDKANCRLDRTNAWVDPSTGLLCMLIICSKPIRKGQFLMWKYNPYAGPGGFWSFREKRANGRN
jgi:serine/threonine protein kinase